MAASAPDWRDRVLQGLTRGAGATSMARRLEVRLRWGYHGKARDAHSGARPSGKLGGSRRSRVADMPPQIRAWLHQDAASPLVELRARVAPPGAVIPTTAVWQQREQGTPTLQNTAARQRARTRRRAGGTRRVASTPAPARGDDAGRPRGHRRPHADAPRARPCPTRGARPRCCAARPLAHHPLQRRLACRRDHRADGTGRP